jgi:hypothetical protein
MLRMAHEFVREGWCQGSHAEDAVGRSVSPTSAFACKWSAPGALERAWSFHEDRLGSGLEAFEHANLAFATAAGEVPQTWNDARERTHQEVLGAFMTAIEHVGGPPKAGRLNPPKVGSAAH